MGTKKAAADKPKKPKSPKKKAAAKPSEEARRRRKETQSTQIPSKEGSCCQETQSRKEEPSCKENQGRQEVILSTHCLAFPMRFSFTATKFNCTENLENYLC